jgi:hypothetical protein
MQPLVVAGRTMKVVLGPPDLLQSGRAGMASALLGDCLAWAAFRSKPVPGILRS